MEENIGNLLPGASSALARFWPLVGVVNNWSAMVKTTGLAHLTGVKDGDGNYSLLPTICCVSLLGTSALCEPA